MRRKILASAGWTAISRTTDTIPNRLSTFGMTTTTGTTTGTTGTSTIDFRPVTFRQVVVSRVKLSGDCRSSNSFDEKAGSSLLADDLPPSNIGRGNGLSRSQFPRMARRLQNVAKHGVEVLKAGIPSRKGTRMHVGTARDPPFNCSTMDTGLWPLHCRFYELLQVQIQTQGETHETSV